MTTRKGIWFRGKSYPLGSSCIEFQKSGDWNLIASGADILGGVVSPTPGNIDDLDSIVLPIDLRTLNNFLEQLTGETMTYYPPGGWNAPDLVIRPRRSDAKTLEIVIDAALDWDYNISWEKPEKPADYAPRRLEIRARAECAFVPDR